MFFYVHQSHRHDGTHPGLFTSWGALPSSGLPSCKQRIAGLFFFFFFFFFFFDNNRNFFFPKLFPVVRFEPGTFHSASERLNHSAIPETVLEVEVDLIKALMSADQGSLVRQFQEMPLDVIIVRNQATY